MVAVGTAVARRPPHRSRRAELPHRALASDQTPRGGSPSRAWSGGSLGRSSGRTSHPYSALSPIDLFCRRHSLWPSPLPPLRRRVLTLLCSRASQVLRACPTSRTRASPSYPDKGSRRGPVKSQVGCGTSRLPNERVVLSCEVLACVRGVFDPAGPGRSRVASDLVWPWAFEKRLGIPYVDLSGLNSPARTCPCQRFDCTLASA